MTREEVSRTLMHMEQIRHEAMEAGSVKRERELDELYGLNWDAIKDYVEGREPYDDETEAEFSERTGTPNA